MFRRSGFFFLVFVVATLVVCARPTLACSCGSARTVLEDFEWAGVVVIAQMISVEKSATAPGRISSTRMIVEKSFKGSLKPGDEMVFAQGGGADCIWMFSEESIGRRFLF